MFEFGGAEKHLLTLGVSQYFTGTWLYLLKVVIHTCKYGTEKTKRWSWWLHYPSPSTLYLENFTLGKVLKVTATQLLFESPFQNSSLMTFHSLFKCCCSQRTHYTHDRFIASSFSCGSQLLPQIELISLPMSAPSLLNGFSALDKSLLPSWDIL